MAKLTTLDLISFIVRPKKQNVITAFPRKFLEPFDSSDMTLGPLKSFVTVF